MAENEFPKHLHAQSVVARKQWSVYHLHRSKKMGRYRLMRLAQWKKATLIACPTQCKIAVPVTMTICDVCYDCGTYYASKVEIVQIPKQNAPGGPE